MSEKPGNSNKDKNGGDLLNALIGVIGKGQPAVAVQKVSRFLDSASDLANFLADRVSGKNDAESKPTQFNGKGMLHTLTVILNSALTQPESLASHYAEFASAVLDVIQNESQLAPDPDDRRFKDPLWRDSDFYRTLMQIYLAWSQHMRGWIEAQEISEDDAERVQFVFDQLAAAFSPSNLPIHPSALKRAEKSNGMSAVKGLKNWIEDVNSNQGMPRQINVGVYKLGVDLALTPGQVVYRNDLLELIQYEPQTAMVHQRPILLIPAQINKYYVFDLRPKNSMIGHAVQAGFQVFTISWSNSAKMSPYWGLDTYIEATLEALSAVRRISGTETLNLMSACAGGLTSIALLGYLAETRNPIVQSHSMFVTAILSNNRSILEHFSTPAIFELARMRSQKEGTMDGRALARIFAWLRPADLVWKYWVNNNLMGRQPPPLDVLYWDNDSTRLPAALHSDFIDIYSDAVFERPHKHNVLGSRIDYRNVCVDTYFTAGKADYLMPWKGVYRNVRAFRGNHRFVLSDSGHVQSILRPPSLPRTEYYTNDRYPESASEWLGAATRNNGTWWSDWHIWLAKNSGNIRRAPGRMGSRDYPPLANAPGSYAMERF